jgi:hypothetical protein
MLSTRRLIAAAAAALCLAAAQATAGDAPRYRSVEAARDQGVSAFGSGYFELALDPLEFAASRNDFLARYYLARIYADNGSAHTDHGKAYMQYQRLADEFGDMDPDDDRRAPFVSKTLTALAGYLRSGIVEIGLKPDPARASDYLHHAATFFNDQDAQFLLAKSMIEASLQRGKRPRDEASEKLAIHWLSVLTTEKRHTSAQALLAYLMWRGEHEPLVPKDAQRAMALITVAAENAPGSDRIWIEDYYQEIYCGISSGGRKKSDGMVASYRQQYGRQLDRRERSGLGVLQPEAERTCANGEVVPPLKPARAQTQGQSQGHSTSAAPAPTTAAVPFALGTVMGVSGGASASQSGGAAGPAAGPGMGLIDAGATGVQRR